MPLKKRSGTAPKASASRTLKPKGKEAVRPKGIQKPQRKAPRKKPTAAELKAQVAVTEAEVAATEAQAAGTELLPWSSPKIAYIELQPPDEDEIENNNGYVNRHLKKAKKNYNGSEVKISEDAYDRLVKIYIEVEKRTPESNGITHIFEDYRGYGIMEVIGGQILDYCKELKHASPNEFKLYEIVEALSFFLDGAYDTIWFNVDDGDGVEALVNLVGVMFVDCFRRLDIDNPPIAPLLSGPELSPFKNLPLVMGLAIGFSGVWEGIVCDGSSLFWKKELVKISKKRGIALRDTKGLLKDEDLEDSGVVYGEQEGEEAGDKLDFSARVAAYKKDGVKLGGNHYDLTLQAPVRVKRRRK